MTNSTILKFKKQNYLKFNIIILYLLIIIGAATIIKLKDCELKFKSDWKKYYPWIDYKRIVLENEIY